MEESKRSEWETKDGDHWEGRGNTEYFSFVVMSYSCLTTKKYVLSVRPSVGIGLKTGKKQNGFHGCTVHQ